MAIQSIQHVLAYAAVPALAIAAGGIAASIRAPSAATSSAVQHFSAGVVFAAVATELLPDVVHRQLPMATIAGFALGVAAMLAIKAFAKGNEGPTPSATDLPTALLAALGIDIALDGLLIGIGVTAGERQGLLLTVALTLEVLLLGVSAAVALTRSGRSRTTNVVVTAMFGAVLLVSSAIGAAVLGRASATTVDLVLSFGVAALLYLVTEELLVEAHEVPETPLLSSLFFVGFLALLATEMLL